MNFNTKSNNMSLCISLAMCKYFMTELQNAKKEIKELKQQLAEKQGTGLYKIHQFHFVHRITIY